ncbi:hypothetical protein ABPG75_011544 [Micractinium tetrahymenae]
MGEPAVSVSADGQGGHVGVHSPTAGLLLATVLLFAFLWDWQRRKAGAARQQHTAPHANEGLRQPQQAPPQQRAQQPLRAAEAEREQQSSGGAAAPACSCGAAATAVLVRSVAWEPAAPAAPLGSPFALAEPPAFSDPDNDIRPFERQQQGRSSDEAAGGRAAARLGQRHSPPHLSTVLQLTPFLQPGQEEQAQAQAQHTQQPSAAGLLMMPGSPIHCSRAAAMPAAAPPGSAFGGSNTTTAPAPAGARSKPAAAAGLPSRRSLGDRASLEELRSELSLSSQPMERALAGLTLQPPPVPLPRLRDRSPPRGGSPDGPQLSDWEVSPNELEICRRPDGSLWQLGAGGYGRVYKAMRFGVQPVAVKVLAPTSESRHGEVEEIQREAELLKACKDPNIVAFLGASLSADFTLLVLELCEGGALSANLAAGRVGWYKRGKQVAVDVARGLAYLHGRRLIHLDLKSGNILLDRHGHAKISDLGLARIAAHESAVTATVGTLDWAAPEVLLGQRCTEKADIYSFGVCLWEIATQSRPIRGRMRQLKCPQDCPPEVAALVAACMDPDPAQRPSAQQLVERLLEAPAEPPLGIATGRAAAGARPPRAASMAVLPVPSPRKSSSPQSGPQPVRSSAPAERPLDWAPESGGPAEQQHSSPSPPGQPAAGAAGALPHVRQASPLAVAQEMTRAASSPPDMAHPSDMLGDVYGIGMF